jgi:hypothetical protein
MIDRLVHHADVIALKGDQPAQFPDLRPRQPGLMTTTKTALRVPVTGSRTWGRPDLVWAALDRLTARQPTTLTVVHGTAPSRINRVTRGE